MGFKTAKHTPASAIATSGTFDVSYPAGTDAGSFRKGGPHQLWSSGLQAMFTSPAGFTVSFGTSNITVTYLGTTPLPAEKTLHLQLDTLGADDNSLPQSFRGVERVAFMPTVLVSLGAPDTADADGVCASQSITAAGTGIINGALAAGGVATFDVPRNVVAAWTTTAVMTVTGTDEYGNVMVESSASGATMAGKKAFKTVTAVDVSANVTAATVGTGDVLGLPMFLADIGHVLKEMEDGAAPTAGTLVAGVTTAATATTGDVRGTYDPNSAANGSLAFALIVATPDPRAKGGAQFAG